MGLPFYEKAIAYQQEYNRKGAAIHSAIQTNGLSLSKEWAGFFATRDFLVGVSVEGDSAIHITLRLDGCRRDREAHVSCGWNGSENLRPVHSGGTGRGSLKGRSSTRWILRREPPRSGSAPLPDSPAKGKEWFVVSGKPLEETVAYCGLVCGLCNAEETCGCKEDNHCGKRLSPAGCFQYDCCREKGFAGCWECEDAPCGRDMLAPEKVKLRAFVRCVREDGLQRFAGYLRANEEKGVVYHRDGIFGDYDLDTEEAVLRLLRRGKEREP